MITLKDIQEFNKVFCTKEGWYRDGVYWRDSPGDWVLDYYGSSSEGKGDLISNTMMMIIHLGDQSYDALAALAACKELLLAHKRWEDRMNHRNDSRNRVDNWVKKFLWKVKLRLYSPFRWQHGMTRDPYVFFFAACVMLGHEELIKEVRIPWYIFRPSTMAWRHSLIRKRWWTELLYWRIPDDKQSHFYVKRLDYFRVYAYDNAA